MKNQATTLNQARAKIIADPELREIYYEEGRRLRVEAEERRRREAESEAGKAERMKRFYERHGLNLDEKTAAEKARERAAADAMKRRTEWEELKRLEQLDLARIKAARQRLREMGIR